MEHHHEQAPAHQEVSLTEDAEAKVPVSSSTAPEVPAATWAEWAEQKKQEYGTPNDWVEASPTAKYYQTVANDFFSGIGKWGHEKALEWFPSIYNYGDAPPTTQQSKPGDDSKADLSA